ncbi:hypothetical protein HDV04_005200 [Boothiomyces sp. JEL0838]|nr:hypothetical protein HDV04_005200 [Boothiomyces sp. JEL0838]
MSINTVSYGMLKPLVFNHNDVNLNKLNSLPTTPKVNGINPNAIRKFVKVSPMFSKEKNIDNEIAEQIRVENSVNQLKDSWYNIGYNPIQIYDTGKSNKLSTVYKPSHTVKNPYELYQQSKPRNVTFPKNPELHMEHAKEILKVNTQLTNKIFDSGVDNKTMSSDEPKSTSDSDRSPTPTKMTGGQAIFGKPPSPTESVMSGSTIFDIGKQEMSNLENYLLFKKPKEKYDMFKRSNSLMNAQERGLMKGSLIFDEEKGTRPNPNYVAPVKAKGKKK